MIESTLWFDDVEVIPGLLPLLRAVQRSRMRSRKPSRWRPGNEARAYCLYGGSPSTVCLCMYYTVLSVYYTTCMCTVSSVLYGSSCCQGIYSTIFQGMAQKSIVKRYGRCVRMSSLSWQP